MQFDISEHSHKRLNPLTQSYVLCSPHRSKRPWLGATEENTLIKTLEYDHNCYLCPNNKRAGSGIINDSYTETYSFVNDFSAVIQDQPEYQQSISRISANNSGEIQDPQWSKLANNLLVLKSIRGICKVVCFSPKHNLTIAEMAPSEILSVINTWIREYDQLSMHAFINHVQIFENKGAVMGCSNPHPHGQVWATEDIPDECSKELISLSKYKLENGSCLLCDYASLECNQKLRIVCENQSFVTVVPFWATWPFETLILPKSHFQKLSDLEHEKKLDLADIISKTTIRYDNLFECSFPYSMGIHQSPCRVIGDMHLHLHFYPPLLRSATVKKFLTGFEMLGQPQRDITPEQAAERLRNCSETHYNAVK